MKTKTENAHVEFLAGQGVDPDAFDAIIMGAEGIAAHPRAFDSLERCAAQGGLTLGLFVAKWQNAEGIEAYVAKGGLFTDQTDAEGRTAGCNLEQRFVEAQINNFDIDELEYRREAIMAYREAVRRQGGLIKVREASRPSKTTACDPAP